MENPMSLRHAVTLAITLFAFTASRADTFTTFDLNSLVFVQGSGSGTATLDDTTATFTSADITVTYLGQNYTFSGTPTFGGFGEFDGFDVKGAEGDTLEVLFPVKNFVGYIGGALCNSGGNCTFGMGPQDAYTEIQGTGGDPFDLADPLIMGGATAVPTTTPEPSAFLLLGTGLGGFAVALRKRLSASLRA